MLFNIKRLFKSTHHICCANLKIFRRINLLFFTKILFFLALSSCGKYGKLKIQHEHEQNADEQEDKELQVNIKQSQENKYTFKQYDDDFNF